MRQIELGCWGHEGRALAGLLPPRDGSAAVEGQPLRLDQVNTQSWREANKDLWRLFEEFQRVARTEANASLCFGGALLKDKRLCAGHAAERDAHRVRHGRG
jgi:hypothetical protein